MLESDLPEQVGVGVVEVVVLVALDDELVLVVGKWESVKVVYRCLFESPMEVVYMIPIVSSLLAQK